MVIDWAEANLSALEDGADGSEAAAFADFLGTLPRELKAELYCPAMAWIETVANEGKIETVKRIARALRKDDAS